MSGRSDKLELKNQMPDGLGLRPYEVGRFYFMEQGNLFGFKKSDPEWKNEWEDMPEFIQEDLTSYRKIVVHFRNEKDVQEFSKAISQKISKKLPSLWYPEMDHRKASHLIWTKDDE